jgi:nucleoside-diphosphate kinase
MKRLYLWVFIGLAIVVGGYFAKNYLFSLWYLSPKIEQTLAIIKPDAVSAKNTGKIIDRIEQEKFNIISIKKLSLTREQTEQFYEIHKDKNFFRGLVEFMTSGPIIVMILEKENAIAGWRNLMGSTKPEEAKEGSLRKLFGTNVEKNAVHGSGSAEHAKEEISFFFPERTKK